MPEKLSSYHRERTDVLATSNQQICDAEAYFLNCFLFIDYTVQQFIAIQHNFSSENVQSEAAVTLITKNYASKCFISLYTFFHYINVTTILSSTASPLFLFRWSTLHNTIQVT
jgi:hypothetical protein